MRNLLKEIRYIFNRNQKIKLLVLFLVILGGALTETVGVSVIVPFISIVAVPESVTEQPILAYFYNLFGLKSTNDFLIIMALFLVFIYLAKNLYLFVMYKLQFRFVYNNQMRLSAKLMACYLSKGYEYHANKNSSEIVRSVTIDVNKLFLLILNALLLMTEVLVVVCVGTLLIIIEPIMTLATFMLLGTVLIIFMIAYKKILKKAGEQNQINTGLMIKWINQGLGGIKEIKVMNREQFFINEFTKASIKAAESHRKSAFLVQVPKLLIEAVSICSMLMVISIMLYIGRDLSVMLPQLAALAVAAFRIMPSFNRITIYYNGVVFNMPAIDLIYHDLKESMEVMNPFTNISRAIDLVKDGNILVRHLTYRYPNTTHDIMQDVCIDIPLTKSIALIGSSGAGKTTFADILLGLLQPTSGTITVNGEDIHKNTGEWSKKIGYIPQNIYLCDDTVQNNVAFGICEQEIDTERVWQALVKAQLNDFVRNLPEMLNTVIGERGVKLSGGQRQRIGIARAFYNDPDILVLDEATSSLDNDTEEAVMDAINAVKNDKTLIIIAHRMSTIKNCDVVFRVENEKIVKADNRAEFQDGGIV